MNNSGVKIQSQHLTHTMQCWQTYLQTTPARNSNDLCASDSQFSYCCVNGIPKQRMCDGFNDYCSNGEDEFVQLCGTDECREKNVGCEPLCINTRESYYCQCRPAY
ncbi:low-density lipoprotein receptor-related protein 8-like [Portunus trituberculatus]|uniref:low-density lipoprotein receptor-related protein 8-like n=1 Tax=Portunus trituberculatus TaxID=210409 RepID=UPI001E1CDA10|nr:low-density lipoprotein receptor-related protein 8-like [Portunus trituberculatus]